LNLEGREGRRGHEAYRHKGIIPCNLGAVLIRKKSTGFGARTLSAGRFAVLARFVFFEIQIGGRHRESAAGYAVGWSRPDDNPS
jgi:hypothetical protein